jgi:hypothetical protein
MKSARGDVAALDRSRDLGVKMISGRMIRDDTCQRNRWKYEAGVEGMANVMLSSAHN